MVQAGQLGAHEWGIINFARAFQHWVFCVGNQHCFGNTVMLGIMDKANIVPAQNMTGHMALGVPKRTAPLLYTYEPQDHTLNN